MTNDSGKLLNFKIKKKKETTNQVVKEIINADQKFLLTKII